MSKKLNQNELNILKAWTDSREFGAAELLKRLLEEYTELKARDKRVSFATGTMGCEVSEEEFRAASKAVIENIRKQKS